MKNKVINIDKFCEEKKNLTIFHSLMSPIIIMIMFYKLFYQMIIIYNKLLKTEQPKGISEKKSLLIKKDNSNGTEARSHPAHIILTSRPHTHTI